MDGIAAVEARIAEISARFGAAPAVAPTAGADFAAALRQAMGDGVSAATGAGGFDTSGLGLSSPGLASLAGLGLGGTASGGPAAIDDWIAEAIQRAGVPDSWAPGLRAIAQHESSFNPAAANTAASGGNAAATPLGLMQMLPSTFAAHAQPGHTNILDPVDNLTAAIDYIKGRYGDPASTPGLRALARGDQYVGY